MTRLGMVVLWAAVSVVSGAVLAEQTISVSQSVNTLPAGYRQASEQHWVSGYVEDAGQVQQLKHSGIETVISLVPAEERPGFDEAKAMQHAGLRFIAIPIAGAVDLTMENVEKLDLALAASTGQKTLIHCASGNRVGALMALRAAWIQGQSPAQALQVGKHYGLTKLEAAVADKLKVLFPQTNMQKPM
jgi:protein tyrosine phosphatase (PTP) superfamily phosphohydrolase (DUF442 family)